MINRAVINSNQISNGQPVHQVRQLVGQT